MKIYKLILFILIFIICIGCKSSYYSETSHRIKCGHFCFNYFNNNHIRDELILNNDSTFSLTLYGGGYKPSCTGKWKFVDRNVIRIECTPDNEPLAFLNSANINMRARDIKIIDSNRLKMPIENNIKRKYVILERVKE